MEKKFPCFFFLSAIILTFRPHRNVCTVLHTKITPVCSYGCMLPVFSFKSSFTPIYTPFFFIFYFIFKLNYPMYGESSRKPTTNFADQSLWLKVTLGWKRVKWPLIKHLLIAFFFSWEEHQSHHQRESWAKILSRHNSNVRESRGLGSFYERVAESHVWGSHITYYS